jgi:hypothetical protein
LAAVSGQLHPQQTVPVQTIMQSSSTSHARSLAENGATCLQLVLQWAEVRPAASKRSGKAARGKMRRRVTNPGFARRVPHGGAPAGREIRRCRRVEALGPVRHACRDRRSQECRGGMPVSVPAWLYASGLGPINEGAGDTDPPEAGVRLGPSVDHEVAAGAHGVRVSQGIGAAHHRWLGRRTVAAKAKRDEADRDKRRSARHEATPQRRCPRFTLVRPSDGGGQGCTGRACRRFGWAPPFDRPRSHGSHPGRRHRRNTIAIFAPRTFTRKPSGKVE